MIWLFPGKTRMGIYCHFGSLSCRLMFSRKVKRNTPASPGNTLRGGRLLAPGTMVERGATETSALLGGPSYARGPPWSARVHRRRENSGTSRRASPRTSMDMINIGGVAAFSRGSSRARRWWSGASRSSGRARRGFIRRRCWETPLVTQREETSRNSPGTRPRASRASPGCSSRSSPGRAVSRTPTRRSERGCRCSRTRRRT